MNGHAQLSGSNLWRTAAIVGCFLLAVGSGAGTADAQRADEDPSGIHVGSFWIEPAVAISSVYDTDPFRDGGSAEGSAILTVAPALTISSDWNRHGVRLELGAEYGAFTTGHRDNYLDYSAELAGVLDITREIRITGTLGFQHGHERRGSDDIAATLLTSEPTEFDLLMLSLAGDAQLGRFSIAPFFEGAIRDFDDVPLAAGGTFNNDDRDRGEIEAGVELGYEVQRGYSAFLRPSYFVTDYDAVADDAGLDRDSRGFRVLAGLGVDLTRLFEARFGIGYHALDYAAPTVGDVTGLAIEIGGTWAMTPLTEITFTAERRVEETTAPGASAAVGTAGRIGINHELLRTLTLRAEAGYANRTFEGAARTDHEIDVAIGVDWSVTRRLTISPGYSFKLRDSDAPGLGFRSHVVGVGAEFRF